VITAASFEPGLAGTARTPKSVPTTRLDAPLCVSSRQWFRRSTPGDGADVILSAGLRFLYAYRSTIFADTAAGGISSPTEVSRGRGSEDYNTVFKWPVVAAIKSQFSGPTTTPHGSRYSRSRVALSESGNCRPRRDSGSGVAPVRSHCQGGPDQIYERIKLTTQNMYRASGSVNLTSFLAHEQGCRRRGTPRVACSLSYTALALKLKSRPMSLLMHLLTAGCSDGLLALYTQGHDRIFSRLRLQLPT
jgi:hypothetical protein